MAVVAPGTDVSRETEARLRALCALVARWTPTINLVSAPSLPDIWQRHVVDSLQLIPLASAPIRRWVDLGSGGGFPGLVVATVLAERSPEARVTLVESDRRKAVFLRWAAAMLGVQPTVIADRAEQIAPIGADVVSARALAPLPTLLPIVRRHLAPDGTALLPKGAHYGEELAAARQHLSFACVVHPSAVEPRGVVLEIRDLRNA